MLDIVRLYAIPLAAAGILGLAVGCLGRRSALAALASLAAALVFGAAAFAFANTYAAGAHLALWAESGLLVASAYAVGFAVTAGVRAAMPGSGAASVTPGRGGASPPP
ncbi:MAG TPA: hypothetical protein VKA80_02515, partial [Beijerinckiaceae bacterium]|nr:hypothetical protein [Beijerinckiaceae bacterium]